MSDESDKDAEGEAGSSGLDGVMPQVCKLDDLISEVCDTPTEKVPSVLARWALDFERLWKGRGDQEDTLVELLSILKPVGIEPRQFLTPFDGMELPDEDEDGDACEIGEPSVESGGPEDDVDFAPVAFLCVVAGRALSEISFDGIRGGESRRRYVIRLADLVGRARSCDFKQSGFDVEVLRSRFAESIRTQLSYVFEDMNSYDHTDWEAFGLAMKTLLGISAESALPILKTLFDGRDTRKEAIEALLPIWIGLSSADGAKDEWAPVVLDAVERFSIHEIDKYAKVFEYATANLFVSSAFRDKYDSLGCERHPGSARATLLATWVRHLIEKHEFEYCWRVCTADREDDHPLWGDTDGSVSKLREFLCGHRMDNDTLEHREALVELWGPLASLLDMARDRYTRNSERTEELAVRQEHAVDLLGKYPELVPAVVSGILDLGNRDQWNVLDPVILGLPPDVSTPFLEAYTHGDGSADGRYHARRLLAHANGRLPGQYLRSDASLLGAAENLLAISRTRVAFARTDELWIGDAAIEGLWVGAVETANQEFNRYYDSQFGQDEHEHVAVFAEILARSLNATNEMVAVWLAQRHCQTAFLQASVRRFPKTATGDLPQEGGASGLQSDLAVLLKTDMSELAVADRVTLIQAKKVGRRAKDGWEAHAGINKRQINRLIRVSPCAHYLFLLHSTLGRSPLFLPALMVRDICTAQESFKVPVPMVLRSGKDLAAFLVHDVIGLWTGDPRVALVKQVESGAESGQGLRVVLEIRVMQKDERQG